MGVDVVERPLSVGEIFDRALTMYVKHWLPFSVLALLIHVPSALLELHQSLRMAQHPPAWDSHTPLLSRIAHLIAVTFNSKPDPKELQLAWITLCVTWLVVALVYPAYLTGIVNLARGGSGAVRDWLAASVRRAGRLLGVLLLWIPTYALAAVAIMIIAIPFMMVAIFSGVAPNVLGVWFGGVVAVAFFVTVRAISVPFGWSLFIAAGEDEPAFTALRMALSRSLQRGRFWRTIGVAGALAVLKIFEDYILRASLTGLLLWAKAMVLFAPLMTLLAIPFSAFGALIIVIYYLDARARDTRAT
jgi:hypothetical protein